MCRFTSPASRKRLCMLMFLFFIFLAMCITPLTSQGPPGGGSLAQGRQQPRPADWTSLRPAVTAAELREDQAAGLDGRTRLERDTPGPDPCAQLTPVGGVTLRAEPMGVELISMLKPSVFVCCPQREGGRAQLRGNSGGPGVGQSQRSYCVRLLAGRRGP